VRADVGCEGLDEGVVREGGQGGREGDVVVMFELGVGVRARR
jgi:hypothetical protein